MPINTSMYNALIQPRSVADYAADYDQQDIRAQMKQRNALMLDEGRMKQAEYQRGLSEQQTLQNALRGVPAEAGYEGQINALRGTGLPAGLELADKYRKTDIDAKAKQAEALMKFYDAQGRRATRVMAAPSLESAMSALAEMQMISQQLGIPVDFEAEAQAVQSLRTPEDFYRWAAGHALAAKDMLSKGEVRNMGGSDQAFTTDFTGKVTPGQTFTKTATQGERLQAGTAAEQIKLQREKLAEEQRQFNAPPKALPEKPLPPAALKMQQESLDAIGISSSINADLGAVEKQITDKKLKFGPVSNLANASLNMAGMSTEESRNFASFKSTLERLRNESLRLNTGVQTDGDAQRAWNELFQNINDTGLVQQRLKEIQAINKRGAELHRLRVDSVRGNYGAGPLDSSAYAAQPPALGGGAPAAPAGGAGTVLRFDAQGNPIK